MGKELKLGLRENWRQFSLLVLINGFVGAMVGLERSILPQIAEADFGIAAKTAILSFILVFGLTKAATNYYTGLLANRLGRKKLLVLGWVFAIPVPLLLIYATHWNYILLANVLLGISQGLTWSSTVVMKIDLVGEKNRGLAMGLNESVGYLAVGVVAFLTGWVATSYGLRPYPFFMGIAFAFFGLLGSAFLVKDTVHHLKMEVGKSKVPKLLNVFLETSWTHRNLGSVSQAGLVNNLNDGMIWGLLPLLLSGAGYNLTDTAEIVAVYPAVWGLGQLFTGRLADILKKKRMLFWGMAAQAVAILGLTAAESYWHFLGLGVLLGLGTAVVYPTFLAAIAAFTHPAQRAQSIGVFRLWRDLGYAVGALLTGLVADELGVKFAILLVGGITMASAVIIQVRMD